MSYPIKAISSLIFRIQIFINGFIALGFGIQQHKIGLFILVLLNLLALLIPVDSNRKKLVKINRCFQIIFQAIFIPVSISFLIQSTIYNWNSELIIFLLIYAIIMYIPYTVVLIAEIKTKTMQVIITLFLFVFNGLSSLDVMTMDTSIVNNPIIKVLSNSSFLGALIFMTIILIAMYAWDYQLPKIVLARQSNLKVLIALGIFSIWFTIWNGFGSGTNLLNLFISYDFHAHFTATNILSGLEAGIAEELTFRFAILTILLSVFKNSRFKVYYGVFLSSLLFGLIHLPNTSVGQSINNTILQVLFAIALGAFLSSIYLYTDWFFGPVIIHSLIDIFAFASSGSQIMTGKVTIDDYFYSIIEALIFIIISLFLLKSVKNRNKFNFHF
ncbi:CPBP family intramembrane glutamic endopeptidase [Companilactobacillus keshanensis]|uniref:CPBP family intramembrane glutamic endopeptidase n=1 Tax=Companilactobacillus keshanensis TaxID=2486003 RepID=A0ABW4BRB9_9LACO|nr:CPBP family intramembrane glutamic endopeptidase [Companilactobacillus keshanensis]